MKQITFLAAMLMALNTYCQPDLAFRTVTALNSSGVSIPQNSILLDAQGNTVVSVNSRPPDFGTNNLIKDIVLIKYNTDGELLWKYSSECGGAFIDRAVDMVIDSEDNIIVLGQSRVISAPNCYNAEKESNIIVLKLSPTGELLWRYSYLGLENSRNWAKSVIIDSEDNIYLTSTTYTSKSNMVTIKLDKYGQERWSYVIENKRAKKIGYFNNEIIVLGQGDDAVIVKYRTNSRIISSTDISGEVFSGKLKFDSDGDIYAIPYQDYSVSKFSNAGELLWNFRTHERWLGHSWFFPYYLMGFVDLTIDENKNVYIIGTQTVKANFVDAITYKVDEGGNLLWENIDTNEGEEGGTSGLQIQSLSDGTVLVTKVFLSQSDRYTEIQHSYQLVDENGEMLWEILSDTIYGFSERSIYGRNNLYISTYKWEKEESINHVLTMYGEVIEPLNVKEIEEKLLVYPNPSSAVVNFAIPHQIDGQYNLQVTNTLGKIVYQTQSRATENISINQSGLLTPGMYVVSIFDQHRSFNSTFIVK